MTFNGRVLKEGTDYTLSYKNNTKVNDGSNPDKKPTVVIIGKGNFSGSISYTYTIAVQTFSILAPEDYEIIGYSNNIKKGKAKVTIKGVGNYGGTKTVAFTIKAKGFLWWWR